MYSVQTCSNNILCYLIQTLRVTDMACKALLFIDSDYVGIMLMTPIVPDINGKFCLLNGTTVFIQNA